MVIDYLEKIKGQYQEDKIELSTKLSAAQNEYKENMEFIKVLEENEEPTFESFTPREVNGVHRQKIASLYKRQQELSQELAGLRAHIAAIDADIYQINSVIKVASEDMGDVPRYLFEEKKYNDDGFKYAILQTLENERQRIARELHDSSVQNLTSLVHKTELCIKLLDIDPIRCKLELSSMNKLIRDIIEDARKMIYDLRPMSFDDIGFDVTVERFLDKLKFSYGIDVALHIEGKPYPIDNVIAITLLRVIQESCNNAIKYSKASTINVTIEYMQDKFGVKIIDDGIGFDEVEESTVSRENNSGFGLKMMRERVFLLSGEISIDTSPGKGCIIHAIVPLSKEDNER